MKIVSIKTVCERIGISRSKLWQMTTEGRFPKLVAIDGKRKGYIDDEVTAWIKGRIAERDSQARGNV